MAQTIKDGAVERYADFDNRLFRKEAGLGIRRAALKTLPIIDMSPCGADGSPAERNPVACQLREARYEAVVAEEYNRVLVEQSTRSGRPGISTRTAGRFRTQ